MNEVVWCRGERVQWEDFFIKGWYVELTFYTVRAAVASGLQERVIYKVIIKSRVWYTEGQYFFLFLF